MGAGRVADMPTFAIQRGPTVLCSLDLDTGAVTFHEHTAHPDKILVLDESEKVTFVLDPTLEGMEHRISIGDVPLSDLVSTAEDAGGKDWAGRLIWPSAPYFESARGHTGLLLEAQPEGSLADAWKIVLTLDVFVLPSKLGEEHYDCMANDLQEVSRSLLVDLYGKSRQTHDVRYSKEGRAHTSREQELASISDALGRLSELLAAIGKRPASRVVTEPCPQKYWGGERLSPSAITAMCRSGISPQRADRPVLIRGQRRVESFDIPEHRVTRAFLEILVRRARYCAEAAREHIRAITSERHHRHIRRGTGPSLYEKMDLPKIRRLEGAMVKADRAIAIATSLATLPFLRDARPELVAVRGGSFQRSREYHALLSVIRRFLLENAVWYEGDEASAITKLTSRLFEQWCYLKVVEAFRECGLDLREWTEALRQHLRSRFILDFDRGLAFEGALTADLRLRFRYEPWILGKQSAIKAGETLCRGFASNVAWSPDIVIECLVREGESWKPAYGIVLDCKYKIRNQNFDDIIKYSEIRCTETMRQVVKQLWLITPPTPNSLASIKSEDPAIRFDDAGPSCAPDETVRFRLSVVPDVSEKEDSATAKPDMFLQLAQGTITFLRRHYGANVARVAE